MDIVQRLESAWQTHADGQFEAALQEYIALFDAAEDASLRLSYILAAWAKLAEEYLPAHHALVDLRNSRQERLPMLINISRRNEPDGSIVDHWALFKASDRRA